MTFAIKKPKVKEQQEKPFIVENEYDKQANNFLKSTNSTLTIKYLKKGKYFPDDTEERNIYKFTLTKDGKTYTGTFGQSITDSENNIAPKPYSILSSLSAGDGDTNESFEEFADNFGYDRDSYKARKTFKAVIKERKGIHNLYNESEREQLSQIQ